MKVEEVGKESEKRRRKWLENNEGRTEGWTDPGTDGHELSKRCVVVSENERKRSDTPKTY